MIQEEFGRRPRPTGHFLNLFSTVELSSPFFLRRHHNYTQYTVYLQRD